MDAAAHAPQVGRKPVGPCQRPWPQVFVPRRAVTGAMPADVGSASAEASGRGDSRKRRGGGEQRRASARPGGTPGGRREARRARCALAGSQSVRASQAGAAGARSAWPKSAGGALTPAAGVRGVVFLMAWRRVSLPGA